MDGVQVVNAFFQVVDGREKTGGNLAAGIEQGRSRRHSFAKDAGGIDTSAGGKERAHFGHTVRARI